MNRIRRAILGVAALAACAAPIAVAVTPAAAAIGDRVSLESTVFNQRHADTPAFQLCSYGGSAVNVARGKVNLYGSWDGCNRNEHKYICVRLKSGLWTVRQGCSPSLGYISYSAPVLEGVACTSGVDYSIEVLFFIGSTSVDSYSSAAGSIRCVS